MEGTRTFIDLIVSLIWGIDQLHDFVIPLTCFKICQCQLQISLGLIVQPFPHLDHGIFYSEKLEKGIFEKKRYRWSSHNLQDNDVISSFCLKMITFSFQVTSNFWEVLQIFVTIWCSCWRKSYAICNKSQWIKSNTCPGRT